MKLRDFIKRLLCFDWDAEVKTSTSEDICIGYLEDGKTIFIDPSDCCPTCISYRDGYCLEHGTECFAVDGCDCYVEGS